MRPITATGLLCPARYATPLNKAGVEEKAKTLD